MRKLTILLCLIANISFGQTLKPTDDEAIIRCLITDMEGKPLQTKITFKGSDKEFGSQSNVKGFAEFKVKAGANYRIKIPGSLTYYDYSIDDFPGLVLNLDLKFDTSTNLSDGATDDQALLVLSAFNLPKNSEIEIVDGKSKTVCYKTKDDKLKIALPISNNYRVKINGFTIKNDLITVDKTPQNVMYYVLYISDSKNAVIKKANNEAFFNVIYTNIYTKLPVTGELVELESKISKKKYKGITNENGTYLFNVPKNDTYSVHISSAKNIVSTKVDSPEALCLYDCDILYPSTKELLKQSKDDSTRLAIRDAEYKKSMELEMDKDKKKLKTAIDKEAEIARIKIKENPKYFEKTGNVVCAVIFRVQKNWKSKMIVTDLTGSMYPYMKQLLLWHSLKLMAKEKNDYVFFNDGDHKSDNEKIIGKTGGIYYTASDSTDVIIEKMLETMQNGSGGDGPENDLEALIYAQNKKGTASELILIADNYSPVKDISLLTQLNVPVRIILCGTNWGIHPDYIEIAYKTKGSIHTIEQDIFNLGEMVDGKTLKIGSYEFVYSKGKFFKKG